MLHDNFTNNLICAFTRTIYTNKAIYEINPLYNGFFAIYRRENNMKNFCNEEHFYIANTNKQYKKVTEFLYKNGFEWVGIIKRPLFEECKRALHGNAKLIIHAFYNDITGKKEIQFGSKSIYESYPQHKHIKIEEI